MSARAREEAVQDNSDLFARPTDTTGPAVDRSVRAVGGKIFLSTVFNTRPSPAPSLASRDSSGIRAMSLSRGVRSMRQCASRKMGSSNVAGSGIGMMFDRVVPDAEWFLTGNPPARVRRPTTFLPTRYDGSGQAGFAGPMYVRTLFGIRQEEIAGNFIAHSVLSERALRTLEPGICRQRCGPLDNARAPRRK